tara:strand:- start:248 stop:520 length:273 start_codon:yes stop_codon:yes gene_type:complete
MRGKKMTIENMQFKVNDKLEKRISSLEKNNINNTEIKNALIELNNAIKFITVVLYGESKLTSKTDNEKTDIVSAIVKDINFVNPLINGGK